MTQLRALLLTPPRRPLAGLVLLWLRRARTRAALRRLDARLLADIGLTETERRREGGKWFWEG